MPQGLGTGLGAVPGLLPTPATLLHALGKNNLGARTRSPGAAQEESRGRGALRAPSLPVH